MKKALILALGLLLPAFAGAAEVASVPRPPEPLKLVISGPPGVGKGTMSELLVRDYGLIHVSVGELLRARAKEDPALKERMKRGELLPSSMVNDLVRERLSQPDAQKGGFLLDGYPRQLAQAESFRQLLSEGRVAVDAILALDAPEAELRRRVLGRGREDDTPETFANRIKIYRAETIPAVESLKTHAPLVSVDMTGTPAENYRRITAALARLAPAAPAAR